MFRLFLAQFSRITPQQHVAVPCSSVRSFARSSGKVDLSLLRQNHPARAAQQKQLNLQARLAAVGGRDIFQPGSAAAAATAPGVGLKQLSSPVPPPAAAAAADAAARMQKQPHQQYEHLLMSPGQQQELLQAVRDKRPRIFYHYPCPDGVFAALAATLFFKARGVTPRYVPFEVYRDVDVGGLDLQPDEVAFLLDYSGPDGFPQQLAQHVAQVVVLDHHKTAAEQLSDVSTHPANLSVCLDMQRSGATISRDFFHPEGLSSSLQDMFRWVEDADLWRWALQPSSKAFHAGLAALKLEYHEGKNPLIWQQLMELDVTQVMQQGSVILQQQEELVSSAVAASKPYQLGGAQGLTRGWRCCMGCEVSGDLIFYRSRLGNSLAEHSKAQGLAPVGLVAYTEPEMPNKATHIKVSLRSIDGFDTSTVSTAFGGGGHAAASSCILTKEELISWQEMAADGVNE